MNTRALFKGIIAILLLLAVIISAVACDKLPFFGKEEHVHDFKDGQCECGATDGCQHETVADGKCIGCGEYIISKVSDILALSAKLGEGKVSTRRYCIEVTVKELTNEVSGGMTVSDASGEIAIERIYSLDGKAYSTLEVRPDGADKLTLQILPENRGGVIMVKEAFIIGHEAIDETAHEHVFIDGVCECGEREPEEIETITIAEAIKICEKNSEETAERYYIRATILKVTNPTYGEMTIKDETGELYVYGSYSADGSVGYADMEDRPVKGDEVLLYCTLNNFNGTNQVKNARIIEFEHIKVEYDPSQYTEMSIAEARDADEGTKVKISGVVAQITLANGYKPQGVILVDNTSSIYVYDMDIAGQVEIGNTVEIAGEKAYWILETEINNAQKYGYRGSCQLDSAILLSNDKAKSDFDKSWIEETTVKAIMDTPYTENITNKIYKVTALVNKADNPGYVNYYINDIDGITGSYVYTQCNGGDFAWLDKFDGKFCTVYVVAQNAKSNASGCVWRFLPILVLDEGYTFNTDGAAKYAVEYHGLGQFLSTYSGDPALELITSVSSELLGFEGATLTYSSSNEDVVYFTTEDGKVILHCGKTGSATVTVTGAYGGKEFSDTVEITVEVNDAVDYITVGEAIEAENNTLVTVKGIVGPSLVNQTGFYLIDESGAIPVRVSGTVMETLAIGYEIVVEGTRTITKEGGGQICIDNATVVSNNYGNHEYSTESFITDKTVAEIQQTTDTAEATTAVYVVTAKVYVNVSAYSTTVQFQDLEDNSVYILLYSGNKDQYKWLQDYDGKTITVEVAHCDWNAKGLKGCLLAIVNEDGTKTYNTLNFKK